MDSSCTDLNSVTVFDYDAESGALTEKQTISTLPDDFKGTSQCADVKITPDGQFLYRSEFGHRVRLRRGVGRSHREADDLDAPGRLQGHQPMRGRKDHSGWTVPVQI